MLAQGSSAANTGAKTEVMFGSSNGNPFPAGMDGNDRTKCQQPTSWANTGSIVQWATHVINECIGTLSAQLLELVVAHTDGEVTAKDLVPRNQKLMKSIDRPTMGKYSRCIGYAGGAPPEHTASPRASCVQNLRF